MFLAYVELFHPITHGFDKESYKDIQGFYITILTIKTPSKYLSFISKSNKMDFDTYYSYICSHSSREIIEHKAIVYYIKKRTKELCFISDHPFLRNFLKIQEMLYHPLSLQIVDKIELKTGESICILKTFWLKCIQRKWKKICEYNKNVLKEITTIKFLKKREITQIHSKFHGLRGMWYKSI